MPYILALDQGTTSSRAIVFDHDGADRRRRAAGVPADLPAARLGRARPAGDLGDADRRRRRGARPRAACGRATSPPSASPTSARRPSSGTARPASPSTTRSSGRTAAPPAFCDRLQRDGHEAAHPRTTGLRHRRLLLRHARSPGSSTTSPAPAPRAERRRAGLRHDRHAGWSGSSPAARRTSPTSRNASRTMLFNIHTLAVGRRAAASCSACRASMLPEVRSSSEVYGRVVDDARRRRRRRSPASPAISRRRCSARCASRRG